jgi:hypothetical protein
VAKLNFGKRFNLDVALKEHWDFSVIRISWDTQFFPVKLRLQEQAELSAIYENNISLFLFLGGEIHEC